MASAISIFKKPPPVAKLPKVALPGGLQQIAVKSMNDKTGIVASLLGKAVALNAHNTVLLIPKGGEQRTDKEMRIIEFLSQELQIAVDSLKSSYPNNDKGLTAVSTYLKRINADAAPWLKDFKNESCYSNRTCLVNPDDTDTVSRIVQLVNSYYKKPVVVPDSSPRNFINVLFGNVPHSTEQYNFAMAERAKYREQMTKAVTVAEREAGDDKNLKNTLQSKYMKEVSNNFRMGKELIYEKTNQNGDKYTPESWVSAYWKASHEAETGAAGLVFSVFVDDIIEKLKTVQGVTNLYPIEIYGVQHSQWASKRKFPWNGQKVQVRISRKTVNGKVRISVDMKYGNSEFLTLGLVGESSIPHVVEGQTKMYRIVTNRVKNGVVVNVKLFPEDTQYSPDLNDYVDYPVDQWLWPD